MNEITVNTMVFGGPKKVRRVVRRYSKSVSHISIDRGVVPIWAGEIVLYGKIVNVFSADEGTTWHTTILEDGKPLIGMALPRDLMEREVMQIEAQGYLV